MATRIALISGRSNGSATPASVTTASPTATPSSYRDLRPSATASPTSVISQSPTPIHPARQLTRSWPGPSAARRAARSS
jgi:hypothetical protein